MAGGKGRSLIQLPVDVTSCRENLWGEPVNDNVFLTSSSVSMTMEGCASK